MKFKLFNWIVEIHQSPSSVIEQIRSIMKAELPLVLQRRKDASRKIELIKILRRPKISGLLIEANLVSTNDIRDEDTDKPTVLIGFAKEWVETNCADILDMEI